jgi:hypothetical protein
MKINAYGKIIEIVRGDDKWHVYYLGSEGKKRYANDIVIPSSLKQCDLINYLEDLFHESTNHGNSTIKEI